MVLRLQLIRRLRMWAGVVLSGIFCLSAAESRELELDVSLFKQELAQLVSSDSVLSRFYQRNNFRPVWTGGETRHLQRLQAFFGGLTLAKAHGLPIQRYSGDSIKEKILNIENEAERAKIEAEISQSFIRLAYELQYGILDPRRILPEYKRVKPNPSDLNYLADFTRRNPQQYFRTILPNSAEYNRLFRARSEIMYSLEAGGWGAPVRTQMLRPGDSGDEVIRLRNRLIHMGYMSDSTSTSYDQEMLQAVKRAQKGLGLQVDGIAGPATLNRINRSAEERLKAILVAMERERWLHADRTSRHILVNLTDFSAQIIVDDEVIFRTRTVIGKNENGQRTPEFSDEMEHMVINPTWHVPRSITVNEYLPRLKRNRYAVSHLDVYDRRGRKINRGAVNFAAYNSRNFPYFLKQGPSSRNALGRVKFMFPNKYNIYLHDTPSKDLFYRTRRDFSHGCIRLQQPFEFGYALLSLQSDAPKRQFNRALESGRETYVSLEKAIPIHLIYRTVYTDENGQLQYRADLYGRDQRIWSALRREGVVLHGVGG